MKHLKGIVESPTVPNTTDVLWLDADGGLKAFKNGEWTSTSKELNSDADTIIDSELYYNDKTGEVVPIRHPNISTQPSILPYKFAGNYVYEQLIVLENPATESYSSDLFIVVIPWDFATKYSIIDIKLFDEHNCYSVIATKTLDSTRFGALIDTGIGTVGGPCYCLIQYTNLTYGNSNYYGSNNYGKLILDCSEISDSLVNTLYVEYYSGGNNSSLYYDENIKGIELSSEVVSYLLSNGLPFTILGDMDVTSICLGSVCASMQTGMNVYIVPSASSGSGVSLSSLGSVAYELSHGNTVIVRLKSL